MNKIKVDKVSVLIKGKYIFNDNEEINLFEVKI